MKRYIVPVISGLITSLAVMAVTITGDVNEIKQLVNPQSEALFGGSVQIQNYKPVIPSDGTVATSSRFVGTIEPDSNNAFDLGTAARSWRNIYASGTLSLSGASTVAAIQVGNGTAAAPSISFTSDTDTGIWRSAANTVNITGNGSANGLQVGSAITAQVTLLSQDIRPDTDNQMDLGTSALRYRDLWLSDNLSATGTAYLSHVVPAINNAYDLGSPTSSWRDMYSSGTIHSNVIHVLNSTGSASTTISVGRHAFDATTTFSGTKSDASGFVFDMVGDSADATSLLTIRRSNTNLAVFRGDHRWLFYDAGGTLRGIFGYESSDNTMRVQGGTAENIGIIANVANGSTALGVKLENAVELSTVGAKLTSIQNSFGLGSEEAFFGAGASNPRLRLLPRTGQTANMLEIASSTPGGTATSTVFSVTSSGGINASGTVSISPSNTATTATLRVGQVTGSVGRGGCIPIIDTNGTQRYISVVAGTLTVSTASCE